jgi:stringent starvation protein B
LCAAFVFAVYRRGQASGTMYEEEIFEYEDEKELEPLESDLPGPVLEEEDDDDLELLDELEAL